MEYLSFNKYLKDKFGQKIYKISLDGGFTCPNRDGKAGTRGCIFCSKGGSGDFAESREMSVTEHIPKPLRTRMRLLKYSGKNTRKRLITLTLLRFQLRQDRIA